MISFELTSTEQDLNDILKLQQENLPHNISEAEKKSQGFVTVQHNFDILQKMHNIHPHCIAKADDKLVGYALSMSAMFRNDIEILEPMFVELDRVINTNENYMIMGQVCIDKAYRGKGVFRGLYNNIKTEFTGKFNSIITEIDAKNTRSLNAHNAIGFEEIHRYILNNQTWVIVKMRI